MTRYMEWHRRVGTEGADPFVIDEAQRLLGIVVERARKTGIAVYKLEREFDDGTVIRASYHAGIPQLEVIPAQKQTTQLSNQVELWIPQGFIIEPANRDAPIGWGLPLIEDSDKSKLDGGPLPDRWTVGGPDQQVLLTQIQNAGYPRDAAVTLPMYYDDFQRQGKPIKQHKPGIRWSAFRTSFRQFGAGFYPILAEINARRDTDNPLVPCFRGLANLANYFRDLVVNFGTDLSTYPRGSNAGYKQAQKDGTAEPADTATPRAGFAAVDGSTAITISDLVDSMESALPALTNSTFKLGATFSLTGSSRLYFTVVDETRQWVRCGNLDWSSSINPEIPTLSWTGPRGRSIPPRELACGKVQSLAGDRPFWLDDTETDFQDRKYKLFDRMIYARGRILGVLPNSGYVLGAGVQKIGTVYRLIAIGWHRAEQFYDNTSTGKVFQFDSTSDIHVWYADLPTRQKLVCNPDEIIDGVYDEVMNPRGWQDMGRHRLWDLDGLVTHGPGVYIDASQDTGIYATDQERTSTKVYWQPWFFNASGNEAVCLRGSVYYDGDRAFAQAPCQAIKCHVADNGSSSVESVYSVNGFGPNQVGGTVFAWDYVDDIDVTARFFVDDTGDFILAYDTQGNQILSTPSVITLLNSPTEDLIYYDARTDTFVRAQNRYAISGSALVGEYFYLTSCSMNLVFDGEVKLSTEGTVGGGVRNTFGRLGSYSTDAGPDAAWCERDAWCYFDTPHPRFLVSVSVIDADYVAGLWHGTHPGDFIGNPDLDNHTSVYTTTLAFFTSSIPNFDTMIGITSTDWSTFAGVT